MKSRYEVPVPLSDGPVEKTAEPKYEIEYSSKGEKFYVRVKRKSDGTVM